MELKDTYIEHAIQKLQNNILFKCTWNIFQDRSHVGPQTSPNKFSKVEIISSTFSHHNAMRLEISHNEMNCKNTNMWRLHNLLLNNQCVVKKSKRKLKIPGDKWKWKKK